MVFSWAADGYLSGVSRLTLHTADNPTGLADAAAFDGQVGVFTVPGTVDAQIITRVQYEVPTGGKDDPTWGLRDDVQAGAAVTFTTADFTANAGQTLGMSVLLIADDQFPEGTVPTPVQMRSKCIYGDPDKADNQVFRAEGGVTSPIVAAGFLVTIPVSALVPNMKYWALFYPSAFNPLDDPSVDNDIPIYPNLLNVHGRCLSFWTNRTPLAPVITAPESGSVFTAGRDIQFSFEARDPDGTSGAPGDYRPWSFADMAGCHIQYAPRPTIADPDPDWIDLPIASNKPGEDPVEGQGWYIEYADPFDKYLGARALRNNSGMIIRCGGTNLRAGAGILPSGNWRIRIRTFDYGHALSTVWHTDTAVPGFGPTGTQGVESPAFLDDGVFPTTPDMDWIPEENISPWSEPINVSVTTQVPAPLAISPVNHVAITEGVAEVTLHWQYRNTHVPFLNQVARQVQIRKRGETDWTDLVSGNSGEDSYSIISMLPGNLPDPDPPAGPTEYLTDPGFESNTLDLWETNSPGVVSVASLTGDAHSGTHKLLMSTAPSGFVEHPFRRRFPLDDDDKYFSVKAWAKKGSSTTHMNLLIWMLDGDYDPDISLIGTPDILYTSDFIDFDDDPDWQYTEKLDIPRPSGATQMWVGINSTAPSNANVGDAIDDLSILGSPTLPVELDPIPAIDIPTIEPTAYTLSATIQYEWRVRTVDAGHVTSDWSNVGQFWIVPHPGSGPVIVPGDTIDGATLGCGTHRIEIYRRGGRVRVGELTQVSQVEWNRLRDDISDAKVVVSGWDVDCGNLLKELQTWAYEVVIFRDNGYSVDRVWEGPISLLTYENDRVTIQAKDVGYYLYRRIIKQSMNDGGSTGGDTVVARAARIIQNVMAPDDPNVLAYLQVIQNDNDARQYRNLPAWSRTAYEEIDDMAANAGLDYTAVGRSILVWGTKNRIGTLPELRDENLGSSPIVSEYGAQMANVYSVSDGNGVHGEAYRLLLPEELQTSDEIYGEEGEDTSYGLVEMLSSSWASETEEEAGTYTQEGLETIQRSFSEFAERSIADSYPPPVVVRVPDNTTLNPNTVLSIQHLVPGVAIPLRSGGTLRIVRAIQKLDSMKVVETSGTETISITLSPFNHEDTEIEVT